MKFIFVDGACTGNGKKNAKASYAVICENISISGLVESCKYVMDDNFIITCDNDTYIKPSNNRGELLSIAHALLIIYNNTTGYKLTNLSYKIISDSLISINTITKWYHNRQKNNTLDKFKNIDLIEIIMKLDSILSSHNIIVIYEHVNSHQKCPNDLNKIEIWKGNFMVDQLAANTLSNAISTNTE